MRDTPGSGNPYRLLLAALGIVYGDIGTSPLYTLRESFAGTHPVAPTPANVLGILSLVFWALMIVVTVKYVLFVLRADNRGEGGDFALMALISRTARGRRPAAAVAAFGLVGVSLFVGDSMITPAISVLSAIEGLEVAAPGLEPFVVPLAVAVLVGLFVIQSGGTARVGGFFGPVMLVWFSTLAVLGLAEIFVAPQVLAAVDPLHALAFMGREGWQAFIALGSVVLAITGAEALYVDLGHFGKQPIRVAWLGLVLPALLLNYFGQGALLLSDPAAAVNPFYLLAPSWAVYPLIGLATLATVIASQAVISGAFSIIRQAVLLGYWPRLEVRQTSPRRRGQIYVPPVNWFLMAAVIALVLGFRSSSNLAAAYGIAVTGAMVATTVMALWVARFRWRWHPLAVGAAGAVILIVELAFLSANLLKIPEGGWFPLVVGAVVIVLMSTWNRGKRIVRERQRGESIPVADFLERVREGHPPRVPGTAVFLTGNPDCVPAALFHNLKHNKVLHERVLILHVKTEEVPWVPVAERCTTRSLGKGFFAVRLHFGFTQQPDVPAALGCCAGFDIDMMATSFFISRETLIPTALPGMALWRESLFAAMQRNAGSATDFFRIPANRVIELGTQIEL